jgi:hypothetical protein
VFVFRSRSGTAIRLLSYDGHQKLCRQPSQYAPILAMANSLIRLRILTAKVFETPILIRV